MNEKILAINERDFISKNPLYLDNIQHGFDHYPYLVFHGSEADYSTFLKKALDLNDNDHAYVDFYYGRLGEEEKKNFQKMLPPEQLPYLDFIDWINGIFFPLTETLLPFLVSITARELLFSSFYFTKIPCIVWGNYGLTFPVFFQDAKGKAIYKEIALSCGLSISHV